MRTLGNKTEIKYPIPTTPWCLLFLLIAGFLAVFWPVWRNLIADWYRTEEYSHGFLIVPIALFIGLRKREKLAKIPLSPSLYGLAIVVFALLLYFFARLAEIKTLASLSMVIFAWGATLYVFGFIFLKEVSFPLLMLFLMIPVPAQIYSQATIPLQLIVTKASVYAAGLLGIPILREGNVIHLPNHTLQVVQACSGLRSMISLVTLGAVMGYLVLNSNILRGILLLGGILAAIMTNIVRVFIMILAFHYFEIDLAKGTIHTYFGIGIFLLAILILLGMKEIVGKWDIHPGKE